MRPPWEIEPEKFSDKFWIVAKSAYLDRWRNWFIKLSDAAQEEYKTAHAPPAACNGLFYQTFGKPHFDPYRIAVTFRDAEGLFAPPWVAFPSIGRGSIGWRMGAGEDYMHIWHTWYADISDEKRALLRQRYPEPEEVSEGLPWKGFYDEILSSNLERQRSSKDHRSFDEKRYDDVLRDRYPQFWKRFGGEPDFSGKRVIDFGCGRGGMVQRVMEGGAASAAGIELNRSYYNFANRKVASRWNGKAEFFCEDIRDLDIEPADIITSSNVMEHVMALPETLAALVNHAKPGGELFIGFSPLWHSPFGHHRLMETPIPWAHLPRKNRAFLDRLVDDEGNSPETIQELGFNGATPADFRSSLEGLPVEIISARRNVATHPLKQLAMKAMLIPSVVPALEKYVTIGIYWHLRRTK